MQTRCWIVIAGLLGASGVMLGAYAAHGLEKKLIKNADDQAESVAQLQVEQQQTIQKHLKNWNTATRYLMIHVMAIGLVGLLSDRSNSRGYGIAGMFFLGGIFLFSGILFARVLSDTDLYGLWVMFGGLSYSVGWLTLAGTALLDRSASS